MEKIHLKIAFIYLILTPLSGASQTDSLALKNYDSHWEWQTDTHIVKKILNNHYESGYRGFTRDYMDYSRYPKLADYLGSEAMALTKIFIEEDTSYIKLKNKLRYGFSDMIRKTFDDILNHSKWEKIPHDGFTLKIPIYIFNETYNRKPLEDSIVYRMYRSFTCSWPFSVSREKQPKLSQRNILFPAGRKLEKWGYKDYAMNNWDSLAFFILKEYLQRNPFSKKANNRYYELKRFLKKE